MDAQLLAWGQFEQPFFESTVGIVLRLVSGARISEETRAMFRFASRGSIGDALRRAGFRSIEEQHGTLPRIWAGSPQDLWQYFQEISALFRALLRAIPANKRTEVAEAVRTALAQGQSGDTITASAQVVLATPRTEPITAWVGRMRSLATRPKAHAAYQDFLTLWKDADPDISILKEAKAEYEKVK